LQLRKVPVTRERFAVELEGVFAALHHGSRLAVVVMLADGATSADVVYGELLLGPTRKASSAPTLLFKLALVACMLRPPHPAG